MHHKARANTRVLEMNVVATTAVDAEEVEKADQAVIVVVVILVVEQDAAATTVDREDNLFRSIKDR